jgi:hypothetical protein
MDDVAAEGLNHPNTPPHDHPFSQSSADISLLGDEYADFKQYIIDLRVASSFQEILHPSKKGPWIQYSFKADLVPSRKRDLEQYRSGKQPPTPPRWRGR